MKSQPKTQWPLHFMAVLPVPVVSSKSQEPQRLLRTHLQVPLPLVVISGLLGPMAPAATVPVEVTFLTKGLRASVSGPGLGGAISAAGAPAGGAPGAGFSALVGAAPAAGGAPAGFSVLVVSGFWA